MTPFGKGSYGSKKGRPSKLAKAKAKKKMSGSAGLSKLTKAKAAKMMHEGKAHGKKLTSKQMRFFGAVAGGKSKKVSRVRSRRKTR